MAATEEDVAVLGDFATRVESAQGCTAVCCVNRDTCSLGIKRNAPPSYNLFSRIGRITTLEMKNSMAGRILKLGPIGMSSLVIISTGAATHDNISRVNGRPLVLFCDVNDTAAKACNGVGT